jgi:hypothetical protein
MTESRFQSKLLRALRAHPALKNAVIFKHSDRFNRGVPDFSISIGVRTIWAEVKRYPNPPTRIQQHFINKLGVGCLLITDHQDGKIALWQAHRSCVLFEFDGLVQEITWRCVNG